MEGDPLAARPSPRKSEQLTSLQVYSVSRSCSVCLPASFLSSVCVRVSLVVLITLVVTSLHRVYRCTSQVKSSDGREVYHLKMWSNETIGAVMDVLREQV